VADGVTESKGGLLSGRLRYDHLMRTTWGLIIATVVLMTVALSLGWFSDRPAVSIAEHDAFVGEYCTDCHNSIDLAGNLNLEATSLQDLDAERETWEKVVRKLNIGMMPPPDAIRPPNDLRRELVESLEMRLDASAASRQNPGQALIRRLNRAEYANAVRDLLDLEIDSAALLPPDDSAHGFDNNAEALVTSPLLIDQYLSAAGKIASLAVGDPDTGPAAHVFRCRQDASQDIPAPSMPVGTVGGGMVSLVLPLDGEYRLDVRYFKSNLGAMKGLELPHDVEIAVDGERIHRATIGGRDDFNALMQNITEGADAVEARSSTTAALTAGAHDISVGFVYQGAEQTSVRLLPFDRSSQDSLDVTGHPHIETLTITGPYDATGPGDTASRRRIFLCRPDNDERACAERILSELARRAFRGNDTAGDLETLLKFFAEGRSRRNFDYGIQLALERLLASPKFTFRAERDPAELPAGSVHAVSDLELASRLSFFIWSSIPDDALLALAARGDLSKPATLNREVRRMLADPKAHALVDNFAGQWLYLRNLASMIPNSAGFPNFDDNLRQGLLGETERFFEHVVRTDRPITELMTAEYTFLNERVARHYGIDGVYGNHFRQVGLDDPARFGLLGKGSVLMVSSHTDRTSPVVRGKWVLENLLGSPPPAPPADVPALEDAEVSDDATLRQRLVAHRENPACAGCHALMDPIGFSLENFDAIGAWRDYEYGSDTPAIDASGRLLDGTDVTGPVELREALMASPEIFVSTVVEKLMVYALGRGLVATDMPTVRQIVRNAEAGEYRFSELVLGIVESVPFTMRVKEAPL
jgi:hypothetical protein